MLFTLVDVISSYNYIHFPKSPHSAVDMKMSFFITYFTLFYVLIVYFRQVHNANTSDCVLI